MAVSSCIDNSFDCYSGNAALSVAYACWFEQSGIHPVGWAPSRLGQCAYCPTRFKPRRAVTSCWIRSCQSSAGHLVAISTGSTSLCITLLSDSLVQCHRYIKIKWESWSRSRTIGYSWGPIAFNSVFRNKKWFKPGGHNQTEITFVGNKNSVCWRRCQWGFV